ncbi:probable ATP-dependent helicase PF08_0048 isoform X2 [Harpegnathos saltator]|nr:probable ATP-dependent helicase PF08_0048 isoform X2 [Harpegnathos saltator]
MEQEKLIENVKAYEPLYVISHPKYSDTRFKENIWKEIAKGMSQPVAVCKKTWTNLRDSFRRALKKKRKIKSGQAASKIKKWRFEDEMSFLLPFMQERDTCSNLEDISDDDNENELNEDEYDDKNDDRGDDQNDNRGDDRNNDKGDDRNGNKNDDDKDDDVDEELHIENEKKKKEEVNRKIINVARNKGKRYQTQAETASPVMMKYMLDKKTAKEQITRPSQQSSAVDTFFASIALTVKSFSPYYQNIAKSQIFSIISNLEMKQIMQEQPVFVPNSPTPTQR